MDVFLSQAVWALGNIAGDSPDFRDLVLKSGGLNPLLHQIRLALQSPTPKVTMLRNATWTLSNCARGKPRASLDQITSAIPIIKELIFSTDVEVTMQFSFSPPKKLISFFLLLSGID